MRPPLRGGLLVDVIDGGQHPARLELLRHVSERGAEDFQWLNV